MKSLIIILFNNINSENDIIFYNIIKNIFKIVIIRFFYCLTIIWLVLPFCLAILVVLIVTLEM